MIEFSYMKSHKISSPILFLVFLILFPLFVSSCIDNGDGGSQSIKKEKISGYVQKGPFVSGTSILMSELNSELAQTGKVFTSQITNDQGLFEITNIELNSSFVEFSSSGFYFNEVTGEISSAPITLTSISDLSNKSFINVNVLTHLEKKRVENLIKGGKSFSEAKKQAKNEVLSIFSIALDNSADFEDYDISKNNEEGGILLAISIILQGNRSVGQLTELLSKIQSDIASDGKLDDNSLLNSLRVSTFELDLAAIRAKVESRNKALNITSTVPDFEKHVIKFLDLRDLKITIEGEGTVTEEIVSNPSGKEYPFQTQVKLTPVAKEGWVFESWGGDLSGTEPSKTITFDKEKNVTVKFKRRVYQLNIIIEGEGSVIEEIVSSPNGREYPFQTVVKLTPVPKVGWLFESWGGDLSGVESSKTITIDKEKTVIVNFRNPVFRIAENGVTCVCENVKPGEKGFINGVEFEAVDNDLIIKRRNEGTDMSKLCTSLVTNMSNLFSGYTNFDQSIGNWDVSNVTTMEQMFRGTPFNQPIGNWNVSKVTNMKGMFTDANKFNKPIGSWDVGNVENFSIMFSNAWEFNQPIGGWNVSKAINLDAMFQVAQKFNFPLNNWNVSNVKTMKWMFAYASEFNQDIGNWNVSNVKDMSFMFAWSKFNQSIRNWSVKNVIDFKSMFQGSIFNQNISQWCVTDIKSEPYLFSTDSPLTPENKPKWGTCPD